MAEQCETCTNVNTRTNMKTNRNIMLICGAIALPFMAFILQAILTTNQSIATTTSALAEYKNEHSVITGDLRVSIEKINGSVNVLASDIQAVSDDMIDVKTSNQSVISAVTDLTKSLERKGILASTPLDSSTLLASDFN